MLQNNKELIGPNLDTYNGINITVRTELDRYPILKESSSFQIESFGWEKIDQSKKPHLTLSIDESIAKFEPSKDFEFDYTNATAYYYEPLNRVDNGGGNENGNGNGDGNGDGNGNGDDDKSNVGLIVGVVVACVVVVAVVIVVVIIVIKKKRAQKSASNGEAEVEEE